MPATATMPSLSIRLSAQRKAIPLLLLTALAVAGCTVERSGPGTVANGASNAQLHALFADYWEFQLEENPLLATTTGDHRADDRLPSVSIDDRRRRAEAAEGFLDRLRAFDRVALDAQDGISAAMLEAELTETVEDFRLGHYRFPMTVDNGFHISFARLPTQHPFATGQDYRNYISRLEAWPAYVDQHIALLRDGIAAGMTLPNVILDGYEVTIESHVVEDVRESVFFPPFASFPVSVPESERAALLEQGESAIRGSVVPGYRRFLAFMLDEYVPASRTTIGASDMPGGREYYEHRIRVFTTLDDTSAEEIHEIGLAEVGRIRAEMEAIVRELRFEDDFASFLAFLRTDPRFYAETPEGLAQGSRVHREGDGR